MALLWEGFRESRRCSRDTYPESYITEYTLVYADKTVRLCAFNASDGTTVAAMQGPRKVRFLVSAVPQ